MFFQKVSTALGAFPRAGKKYWAAAAIDTVLGGKNRRLPDTECRCGSCPPSGLLTLNRPVLFVFRPGTSAWGSVRIRVFQAASALRAAVSNPKFINLVTEDQLRGLGLVDFDLVLSKYALTRGNLNWYRALRERGNRVFADVVDGFPVPGLENYVDAFVCASRSEFEQRSAFGYPAVEVLHQVDTRFRTRPFARAEFSLGYLGGIDGAAHVPELPRISTHFTGLSMSGREVKNAYQAVSRWSHHYSVRTFFGDGVHKPATKAFLAARFGAVFLGSRDDTESLLMLGPGYPYLATTSALHDVQEMVGYAEETFGGPVWERSVAAMERLRRESCDVAVALRFAKFLNHDA